MSERKYLIGTQLYVLKGYMSEQLMRKWTEGFATADWDKLAYTPMMLLDLIQQVALMKGKKLI